MKTKGIGPQGLGTTPLKQAMGADVEQDLTPTHWGDGTVYEDHPDAENLKPTTPHWTETTWPFKGRTAKAKKAHQQEKKFKETIESYKIKDQKGA